MRKAVRGHHKGKKSLKRVLQLVDTSWGKRNTIRFYIALCQDSSDKKGLRG